MLSLSGEILGINTYRIDESKSGRTAEGLGFAVSENTVQGEISTLKAGQPAPTPTPTPTRSPAPRRTQSDGDWTYFGSECPGAYSNCVHFSSENNFIALDPFNHYSADFYEKDPYITIVCDSSGMVFEFNTGVPGIGIGETVLGIAILDGEKTFFYTYQGLSGSVWFMGADLFDILTVIDEAERRAEVLEIWASADMNDDLADRVSMLAYFNPQGFLDNYYRLSCAP